MPTFDIVRKNKRANTFRTQSIIDRYELKKESEDFRISGKLQLEGREWSIGLIVGGSGTGKSTIAKDLFGESFVERLAYSDDKAIIDDMPKEKTIDEITEVFNSTGLGTAWSWLKPYRVLSTGEKMRVDLARCLLEDRKLVVFDEFTSVVDRSVAKIASFCISKSIRKAKRQFVAVSCHKDIIEWLEPDWIFNTDTKQFFFAQEGTLGQKLTSRSFKQIAHIGSFSRNITI